MNKFSFIAVGLIGLTLTACTSGQVTSTLDTLLNVAIAYDATTRPQDIPYLNEISSCADAAVSELASNDTPAIKSSTVALGCASALSQASGQPIQLQAVIAALNTFLNSVEASKTALVFSHPEFMNSFAVGKVVKLSPSDAKRIHKKIAKLKKKLAHKK